MSLLPPRGPLCETAETAETAVSGVVSGPPPVQRGPVLFHVGVGCCMPLVLVCPSECSSVCSSFRSPCVRRPSALSPLFYLSKRSGHLSGADISSVPGTPIQRASARSPPSPPRMKRTTYNRNNRTIEKAPPRSVLLTAAQTLIDAAISAIHWRAGALCGETKRSPGALW